MIRCTKYRALADAKNGLQEENLENETNHLNQINLNSNEPPSTKTENKKLVQISRPSNGCSLQPPGQISDIQCERARN